MDNTLLVFSFFSMIFAWVVVIAVSLYGAVRCLFFDELLESLKILLVLPLWLAAQTLFFLVEKALGVEFFENGVAIAYYLLGAGLICYVVIRHVRWLTVPPHDPHQDDSREHAFSGQDRATTTRRIAGLVFVVVGAVALSSAFIPGGVLLIVVGVSLLMNVNIWRR